MNGTTLNEYMMMLVPTPYIPPTGVYCLMIPCLWYSLALSPDGVTVEHWYIETDKSCCMPCHFCYFESKLKDNEKKTCFTYAKLEEDMMCIHAVSSYNLLWQIRIRLRPPFLRFTKFKFRFAGLPFSVFFRFPSKTVQTDQNLPFF